MPPIAVLAVVMIGAGLRVRVAGRSALASRVWLAGLGVAPLQAAIDAAVIVNALKTSRSPRAETSQESPHTTSGLSRQTPLPREVTIRA